MIIFLGACDRELEKSHSRGFLEGKCHRRTDMDQCQTGHDILAFDMQKCPASADLVPSITVFGMDEMEWLGITKQDSL